MGWLAEKIEEMKKYHHVAGIEFTESTLVLEVDGERHEFQLEKISNLLNNANMEEKTSLK